MQSRNFFALHPLRRTFIQTHSHSHLRYLNRCDLLAIPLLQLTFLSVLRPPDRMSGEKLSQSSSNGVSAPAAQTTYVDLDEQRRAALAEIDNASFRYAERASRVSSPPFSSCVIAFSMSRSAWLLVSVSSLMRMWSCNLIKRGAFPLILILLATISSPSTSHPSCWVMCTAHVSSYCLLYTPCDRSAHHSHS